MSEQVQDVLAQKKQRDSLDLLDFFCQGWRPQALILLVLLACALPGFLALQPLDRDESRFVQATTQMFETSDFIRISFQDEPRNKKPIGIHWLQAATAGPGLDVLRREAKRSAKEADARLLGEVTDEAFSARFFGIWLSPKTSQPRFRDTLLAQWRR